METLLVIAKICCMYLLADFVAGLFHWWEDAYGNPTWPIIGKTIIQPNLEHHRRPRKFLVGSYWNRINSTVIGVVLVSVIVYLCGYFSWQFAVFALFLTQSNEIHAISHRSDKENGKFLCFLQKTGILQRRSTHGHHHSRPYNSCYCVMTEYLNPVLDRIRFWDRLEAVIAVFGIKPLRGDAIRDGL